MNDAGLYDPFDAFTFKADECFLTGKKINPETETIPVFPEWIMDRYELRDKPFSMLGENAIKYASLRIPCAADVKEAIHLLEEEIEKAYTHGYDAVKELPEIKLFQWMAKLVYGILYHDNAYAIRQHEAKGKSFKLSPFLNNRFSNLHRMLQSLVVPMEFKIQPWSISVTKINYSKDIFNYKDETKNLNFSLAMNGFGLIACLQDNGENSILHEGLVNRIGDKPLHAIQFEELWCRFMYSNYLLRTSTEYSYTWNDDKILVESIPLAEDEKDPLFKPWDEKMYAQVLANYWKPWGLTMGDIISFPNSPISYLLDEYTNQFIEPESINLQS